MSTTQDAVIRSFVESMPSTAHLGIRIRELGPVAVAETIKPGRRHAIARADVFNDTATGSLCLTGTFTATGIAPS